MITQRKKLILLPDSFNMEQHTAQYPPEQYGFRSRLKFNKEKAYYFLSLISSIAARSPDIVTEDGYTPINQRTVRDDGKKKGTKCIKDIKAYIDYLKQSGVILCNDSYIAGTKSFGYKYAPRYSLRRYSVRLVESQYTDDFISNFTGQYNTYPYLFQWYQSNLLMIDDTAANDYAFQLYVEKMNDPTKASWDRNNKGEPKEPEVQYRSALLNIAKIKYHLYGAHIDETVGRLHSAFTGLNKKYRQFVTYAGERLVGIDITNSQPYIISLILNKNFWADNSTLPINIKNLSLTIQIPLCAPMETLFSIRDFLNSIDENNLTEYKDLVSSGRFYETFIEKAGELGRTVSREEVKTFMFYTIYSSNKYPKDLFLRRMRIAFNQMFPEVAKLFKLIKHEYELFKGAKEIEKQHNTLACLLQSIESMIMLHRCCKKIWKDRNHQVPIFTIHDSIYTTVEHQDYVKHVMEEELTRVIGIPPKLKPEVWSEES